MKDRVHGFVSRGSQHVGRWNGGSEDTNGRSESEIKFGFIGQFSNERSMLVKYKKE